MPYCVRFAVAWVIALACTASAAAQTDYVWNYAGADWSTNFNWSPNGVPTSSDTAILSPFDGSAYTLPSLSSNSAAGQFVVLGGPRPFFTGTIAGGGKTLTVGTGGTMTVAPFTDRGAFGSTLTLNNLTANVATGTTFASGYAQTIGAMDISGFSSRIMLSNGSQMRMVDVAGTKNYDLTINGQGQLFLNAGTQITNGLGVNSNAQGSILFHGGGWLSFQGANTGATTFSANQIVAASGHSRVGVFFGGSAGGGATTTVNLGNSTIQRGLGRYTFDDAGNFLSFGTGTIELAFNGTISGFSGSQSQVFAASGSATSFQMATQNGVITEGSSFNTNSPYVIMTGSVPGIIGVTGRFATWNSTTGEVTAQLGTPRDENNLSSVGVNENTVYRPTSSSANPTLIADISPQTIVFEARDTSQFVDLGGHTLRTPGIIVERILIGNGDFNFSLNNGTIAGSGASLRNIFVLGASNTFFNVGATFAGGGGGIVKSGQGTIVLTGNAAQMDIGNSVYINEGAIRAKIDGGTANLGTSNTLALRGGVLEVDANGSASTFSRSLGTGLGQVNWTNPSSTSLSDRGGGGFAVVNGNLDINIGGSGQTLIWNGTSGGNEFFLRSGLPLRLGSFQSTGVVTLQNNLGLDDGSAGQPFENREIIVEQLTYSPFPLNSQRSRITGVISGSASTGLMKSGPGMLELTAANTYAGGTTVGVGTLLVNNTTGSGTGTGRVTVYGMLMGNGIIAPSSGNGLTVMSGGYLLPYGDQFGGTPGHLTVGSTGTNNPVTLRSGAITLFQLNGTTFDPAGGSTSYSRLTVKGTGAITITGAGLNVGLANGFTPSGSDVFGILDNQTANAITGTFNGIAQGGTVNAVLSDNTLVGTFQVSYTGDISGSTISISGGNDVVLYNFTPVPEPASVTAICGGAVGFFGLLRRARRRD